MCGSSLSPGFLLGRYTFYFLAIQHRAVYLTFLSFFFVAKLLAEVENMAALQPLTLGGSGGDAPIEVFKCSKVHSQAYRKSYRAF